MFDFEACLRSYEKFITVSRVPLVIYTKSLPNRLKKTIESSACDQDTSDNNYTKWFDTDILQIYFRKEFNSNF